MVLKIFFSGQIFLILKFEIFELKYFLRPWSKNFDSSDIVLQKVVFKESHWQNCRNIFLPMFAFQPYCALPCSALWKVNEGKGSSFHESLEFNVYFPKLCNLKRIHHTSIICIFERGVDVWWLDRMGIEFDMPPSV